MTEDQDARLIFRPTKTQYDRVNKLFTDSGRYKHLSELLRHITEIGLDELEEKNENRKATT